MIRLFTFFLLAALSFQSFAGLIYKSDFESGALHTSGSGVPLVDVGWMNYTNAAGIATTSGISGVPGVGASMGIVTSPVLSGTKAIKMGVNYQSDYRPHNDGGYQKPRNGYYVPGGALRLVTNTEYFTGFAFFLPADYVYDPTNNPIGLYQLVKLTNSPDGKNMIDVVVRGTNIETTISNTTGVASKTLYKEIYEFAAAKGVWHQIVWNYKLCKLGQSGCSGFFKMYVNGNNTPVVDLTGPNTIDIEHQPVINTYKYAWHCTLAGPGYNGTAASAQQDYPFCMTNPNPTNSTAPIVVYFDNFNIATAPSSITEVMPSWGGAPPNTPEIIGLNQNQPIVPNISYSTPAYFTGANDDFRGCSEVKLTDTFGVESNALPCNSNATGGRFETDALSGLSSGVGSIAIKYKAPLFDSETTSTGLIDWNDNSNGLTIEAAPTEYGYAEGVKITNIGALADFLYPATADRVSVSDNDLVEGVCVFKADTSNRARCRITQTTGSFVEASGIFGSMTNTTTSTGELHQGPVEWVQGGLRYVKLAFTATVTGTSYRMEAGTNENITGKSIFIYSLKLWKNKILSTVTRDATIQVADTLTPERPQCDLSHSGGGVLTASCSVSEAGTLRMAVTNSTTFPSTAQILAGNDHADVAAMWKSAALPITAGTLAATVATPALDIYKDRCLYAYVVDTAGNTSEVGAGEACIDAENPVVKKIKFSDTNTRLRKRDGTVFNDTLDFFTLHPTDPRLPGPKTDLVYIDNPSIPSGVIDFDEADTQCGTCSGSINALTAGTYWYSARSTDGTVKSVNTISVVVE